MGRVLKGNRSAWIMNVKYCRFGEPSNVLQISSQWKTCCCWTKAQWFSQDRWEIFCTCYNKHRHCESWEDAESLEYHFLGRAEPIQLSAKSPQTWSTILSSYAVFLTYFHFSFELMAHKLVCEYFYPEQEKKKKGYSKSPSFLCTEKTKIKKNNWLGLIQYHGMNIHAFRYLQCLCTAIASLKSCSLGH